MLYLREVGQGEPVVLLHPVGTSSDIWWQHLSRLSQRFRVIAIDLPGHGRSPSPTEDPLSIETMAKELHNTLDINGLLPAHLVGLSLGGLVAQTFAVHYPDSVKTMTVCGAMCQTDQTIIEALETRAQKVEQLGMEGTANLTLQRWFPPEFLITHNDVVSVVETLLLNANPTANAQSWRAVAEFDLSSRLKTASLIKTLVINGDLDISIPPDTNACLSHRFSAQVETLKGCAHMAPVEAPEKFMDILESFLLSQS